MGEKKILHLLINHIATVWCARVAVLMDSGKNVFSFFLIIIHNELCNFIELT